MSRSPSSPRRKFLFAGGAIGAASLVALKHESIRDVQERWLAQRTRRDLVDEADYLSFLAEIPLRHLTPQEIIRPHRNIRNGIRNELPPAHMWPRIRQCLLIADEIRDRLGVPLDTVFSAYRSPAYNAECPGAVRHSMHTRNRALDLKFRCSAKKSAEMAKQLRREKFFRGGVGTYRTFIHIDDRGLNATWDQSS